MESPSLFIPLTPLVPQVTAGRKPLTPPGFGPEKRRVRARVDLAPDRDREHGRWGCRFMLRAQGAEGQAIIFDRQGRVREALRLTFLLHGIQLDGEGDIGELGEHSAGRDVGHDPIIGDFLGYQGEGFFTFRFWTTTPMKSLDEPAPIPASSSSPLSDIDWSLYPASPAHPAPTGTVAVTNVANGGHKHAYTAEMEVPVMIGNNVMDKLFQITIKDW